MHLDPDSTTEKHNIKEPLILLSRDCYQVKIKVIQAFLQLHVPIMGQFCNISNQLLPSMSEKHKTALFSISSIFYSFVSNLIKTYVIFRLP